MSSTVEWYEKVPTAILNKRRVLARRKGNQWHNNFARDRLLRDRKF